MSYSINFQPKGEEPEVFWLCNVGTWSAFSDWVKQLPPKYDELKSFVTNGQTGRTDLLSDDLLTVQVIDPPPEDSAAASVLEDLIEHVGVGDDDESAYISQE